MFYGEVATNEDGFLYLRYIGESEELPIIVGVLIVSLDGRDPFPSIGWFYDDVFNVFSAISAAGDIVDVTGKVDQARIRELFTLDELTAIRTGSRPNTTDADKIWVCWDYLSSIPLVDLNEARTQEILDHLVTATILTTYRRDAIITNTLP